LGSVKAGVFGGTFNPIHLGHLHLARSVQRLFGLEQIHFVVATAPPHKPLEELVPFIHRYAMVSLATASRRSFAPSLAELDPPSSPFSLHTMAKFARRQAGMGSNLYFVAGGDSLLDVGGWHESGELLTTYNFIFVARAGVPVLDSAAILPPDVLRRIRDLRALGARELRAGIRAEKYAAENRIFIVDVGAPDISASRIRSLVSAGKAFSHLVPPAVCQYIQKLHLYGER
jgi:nicotinate-nucleotide adenylyltransferase